MTILMGKSEAEDRMRRETMNPSGRVAIDHNYYSEDPEKHCKKEKHSKKLKNKGDEDWEHFAIGGATKVRDKFPFTKGR